MGLPPKETAGGCEGDQVPRDRCPCQTHGMRKRVISSSRSAGPRTAAPPAEAQVPEVDEVLVPTQPPGWVKFVRIGEEGRVPAHGIDGYLH